MLGAVSKKPDKKRWNFLWNFHRDQTVELSVDFSRKVPHRPNRGTLCGISTECSTETKSWNFLWKFHRKFHGSVSVELSVEFSQKVLRFFLSGKFHRKFHRFVSGFMDSAVIRWLRLAICTIQSCLVGPSLHNRYRSLKLVL